MQFTSDQRHTTPRVMPWFRWAVVVLLTMGLGSEARAYVPASDKAGGSARSAAMAQANLYEVDAVTVEQIAMLGYGGALGVSGGMVLPKGTPKQFDLGLGEGLLCYGVCFRTTLARFTRGGGSGPGGDYDENLRLSKAETFPGLDVGEISPGNGANRWSFLTAGAGLELGYYGFMFVPHYMVDWWTPNALHYRHVIGVDIGAAFYFAGWLNATWEKEGNYSAWHLRLAIGGGIFR